MRVAALMFALASTPGCALGFGTPYPRLPVRVRYDDSWELVNLDTGRRTPYPIRNESGGGYNGLTLGVALGQGTSTVDGVASDAHLTAYPHVEYARLLVESLSLALTSGVLWSEASLPAQTTLETLAVPLDVKAVYCPLVPFVLHAGAAVDYHRFTLAVGDATTRADGLGFEAFGGLGISFFYGGVGLLVEGQYRYRPYGKTQLGAASHDLSASDLLIRGTLVW